MRRFFLMIIITLSLSMVCKAEKPAFELKFHGFVGVSVFSDSRASATARNRHIYLYPLSEDLSTEGIDLNKRGEFNIDVTQSRFGVDLIGPTFKNIQTTAMLEGDFLGNGSGDNNFRLRHAFARFSGERWSLLAGQTWHPLFIPENCPGTVDLNAGAPFHPLNFSPQIQFSWQALPSTKLLLYVIEQNNFRSAGFPKGSEESLQPEFDVQIKWQHNKVWAALTAGMNTLALPREIEPTKSPVRVRSFHYNASFRYRLPALTIQLEGIYGGNLSGLVMPGGIGITADNKYKPLQTGSLWLGMHGNRTQGWQPGLFAGYLKSMGSSSELEVVKSLSRHPAIGSVYAISPRVKYIFGNMWLGAECQWTTAEWGKSFDAYGVPEDTKSFENWRFLLSARYNF